MINAQGSSARNSNPLASRIQFLTQKVSLSYSCYWQIVPLSCIPSLGLSIPFKVTRTSNPGQNVLGHLRKLGTKTHFAKLTHILPLKKAWGCCYKGLFLLSHSLPSSVDCVELKLEYITSTLHRGGRGEGRCLNLTSYCVSVPRVLTRVVSICALVMFLNRVFGQEWFNQFLWFLASLIKNGRTLKKNVNNFESLRQIFL